MHDIGSDLRASSAMAAANAATAAGMAAAAVLCVLCGATGLPAVLAASSAGAYIALSAAVWLLSPKGRRSGWLGLSRLRLADVAAGTAAMLLAYPTMIAVAALSAVLVPSSTLEIGDATSAAMSGMPALVRALAFAAFPAFGEELLCRGMVYSAARRYGRAWGIVLPAACFAAMHGNVQQMSYAFLCGLLLSAIRDGSGSLWPCVAAHFAFNAISAVPAGGAPAIPAAALLLSPFLACGTVVLALSTYKRNTDLARDTEPSRGSPVVFSAMLGLGTLVAILSGRLL